MKYLKEFNETKVYIYKSPDGLIDDIKEIFYIMSDYGCEVTYSEPEDYLLEAIISQISIDKRFSNIQSLIRLKNKLEKENDFLTTEKLIELYTHLERLKEDKGGFDFSFYGNPDLEDDIEIDFRFYHDKQAIINDINGKLYLNDDAISEELKTISSLDYSSWEITSNAFYVDFYMNKREATKLMEKKITNHFSRIIGEYFKIGLTRERDSDFEEVGDYIYTLSGNLIKGEMAPI